MELAMVGLLESLVPMVWRGHERLPMVWLGHGGVPMVWLVEDLEMEEL